MHSVLDLAGGPHGPILGVSWGLPKLGHRPYWHKLREVGGPDRPRAFVGCEDGAPRGGSRRPGTAIANAAKYNTRSLQHEVHHKASAPAEMLNIPGAGECGVNVMFRTALFPRNRARNRNTTPSPQAVFRILAGGFSPRLPLKALAAARLDRRAAVL